MAPRGTTVLGVCVNIGSMLAPSWVPRNQPAHGRRVDAARGCKRRSAHARKGMDRTVGDAQVADKELPGTRGTASIIMVHRLSGTGRAPDPLDRCLQSDFRLILPDLHDHGRSKHHTGARR